ncbi:Pleckstrin homology domain-containing protein [Trichoderma austrokoningii]
MAEEHKPVDVAAPVAEEVAPVIVAEETPAVETAVPVVEDKPAEETKPAETEEAAEAPKEEDKKEEEPAKPIEEGFLGHKAQGASFPKNLIASKAFFYFGSESVEADVLAAYKRAEKHVEVAQHNIAWAAHTGKGLLFIGDKKAPHGVINLSDATEPETDGSNKFHFTAKGNKHSFKAVSAAERDNWVAQLKEKIAEAKELAAAVTESEVYKQTIESFKPAPKEEKVEAPKEEAAPVEEAAVPAEEAAAKTEEAAKEEPAKDELKVKENERRSASRKRTSFFGFGKKEEKKEEAKTEETPATETPAVVEPVPEVEAPATEEVPAAEPAAAEGETKASDELLPESPKEKPAVNKRTSFFGNVFSKKEKKAAEAKPEIESPKEEEVPAAEAAPVIPPVEATTPLAVDVASPATVPTETTEVAATNGDAKKEKEKRKSSLPFNFGKRDKSPGPAAEGDEKKGAFSKLRATIKGKGAAKSDEKPIEEAKEEDAIKEEDAPTTEEAAKTEEAAATEEAPKPVEAEAEAENKPEDITTATPAVTAAA